MNYPVKNTAINPFVILMLLVCTACENAFMESPGNKSPMSVFEEFYQVMDEKYVLGNGYGFEYNYVMDSMRDVLKANPTDEQLKVLFDNLFQRIADGHSQMFTTTGENFHYDYLAGYPTIVDQQLLVDKYLNPDDFTFIKREGNFGQQVIDLAYGKLSKNPKIGYLYIPTFINLITDQQIDKIFESLQTAESLILDLRGNTGGYINVATNFASRFYAQDTEIGVHRIKTEKDKIKDFPFTTFAAAKGKPAFLNKPVVVLIDRNVYSSATFVAELLRGTVDPIFVGQRTGGGTSGFVSGILSNGWSYQIATSELIRMDETGNEIRSNNGFEPDYKVVLNANNPETDEVLEKAINLLQ